MALLYEKRGKIAWITLNRPQALNAVDWQTFQELSQAFLDFRDDRDCWVAVVTGSGTKAFSAGADIRTSSLCCGTCVTTGGACHQPLSAAWSCGSPSSLPLMGWLSVAALSFAWPAI